MPWLGLLKHAFAHQVAKNSVQRVAVRSAQGGEIRDVGVPRGDAIGNSQRRGYVHAPWGAEIGQVPNAHQEIMTDFWKYPLNSIEWIWNEPCSEKSAKRFIASK